jgi:hypothetical protein
MPGLSATATSGSRPRLQLLPAIAGATALLTYGFLVPLLVGFGPIEAQIRTSPTAWVLIVLSAYSGIRIAYELAIGAHRWFVLILHSFAYVFLGIVPLVQIGATTLVYVVDPDPQVLLAAAGVCLSGVLLFDAGLWLGRERSRPYHHAEAPSAANAATAVDDDRASLSPRPRYSADRALLVLIVATLFSLGLFAIRGGFGLVFASRTEMEAALCSVGPYGELAECGLVTALIHVPPVILAILAIGLRDQAHRLIGALAIGLGLFGVFATANPVSTGRFWAGAVAIGLVGVIIRRSLQARLALWLAVPALLVFLFPVLDFGRQRGWSLDLAVQPDTLTQKQDFDAFQQVANGITFVDAFGTRDGAQGISALLFFVPRSIWADKAPATGPLVATTLGVSDNTNVSAPLWEEAYVDFGFNGLALVFGALGVLVARLEAAVRAMAEHGSRLTEAVAPFLAGYGVFVLRGPLLPAIGPLVVVLVLVWIVSRSGFHLSHEPRRHPQLGSGPSPSPRRAAVGRLRPSQ